MNHYNRNKTDDQSVEGTNKTQVNPIELQAKQHEDQLKHLEV